MVSRAENEKGLCAHKIYMHIVPIHIIYMHIAPFHSQPSIYFVSVDIFKKICHCLPVSQVSRNGSKLILSRT